jgi:hypothetical protein
VPLLVLLRVPLRGRDAPSLPLRLSPEPLYLPHSSFVAMAAPSDSAFSFAQPICG